MSDIIDAVVSQLPAIITFAIAITPSIIVALNDYPTKQGWAKSFLTVMQMLSVLEHKNGAGTLKAPLTLAAPPPTIGQPVAVAK